MKPGITPFYFIMHIHVCVVCHNIGEYVTDNDKMVVLLLEKTHGVKKGNIWQYVMVICVIVLIHYYLFEYIVFL